jgi:hypothetical protein
MAGLGNIGGIERLDRRSQVETRIVIERLKKQVDAVAKQVSRLIVNNSITPAVTTAGGGGGIWLSYPFVVMPSANLYPNGLDVFAGAGGTINFAEIVCDPDAAAPTADTTFLLGTNSAGTGGFGVTIASGTRRGVASGTLVMLPGQRLYILAPAALNGCQNLYCIHLV